MSYPSETPQWRTIGSAGCGRRLQARNHSGRQLANGVCPQTGRWPRRHRPDAGCRLRLEGHRRVSLRAARTTVRETLNPGLESLARSALRKPPLLSPSGEWELALVDDLAVLHDEHD